MQKAAPMDNRLVNAEFDKITGLIEYGSAALDREWWRSLGDTQLNRMVEEALLQSPTLQAMQARYTQANAIIASIESHNVPHITADASVVRERFSENHIFPAPLGGSTNNQYMPQLILEYDFDFWDARRSRATAALNSALAQRASIESAKLALTSGIVELYVSWDCDEEKLGRLNEIEETISQQRAIIERQYRLGLIDGIAINDNRSAFFRIQQRKEELKRSIEGKKEALCVLGGFLPSYRDSLKRPNISSAESLPVPKEVVLNLLAHRPDITFAKYTVLSKNFTIEESKTHYYPNISLSGAFGFTSFSFSKLIDHSSYTPSLGVALSLPLFDGGERDARLQHSVSDYNASVFEYNNALIKAANEVVMLLKQSNLIDEQQRFHQRELQAKESNREIERKKLVQGLNHKLPYLSAQVFVKEADIDALSIREAKTLLRINLIKALGGGYREDSNASH